MNNLSPNDPNNFNNQNQPINSNPQPPQPNPPQPGQPLTPQTTVQPNPPQQEVNPGFTGGNFNSTPPGTNKLKWIIPAAVVAVLVLGVGAWLTLGSTTNIGAPSNSSDSSSQETTNKEPLRIVKSAWVSEVQGAAFVVEIENRGKDPLGAQLRVRTLDASGKILDEEDWKIKAVKPGEKIYWAGVCGADGAKPAKTEFELVDIAVAKLPYEDTNNLTDLKVTIEPIERDVDYPEVRGKVISPYAFEIEKATVILMVRDKAGSLLWGVNQDMRFLGPNAEGEFSQTVRAVIKSEDVVEAFVHPW